MNTDTCIGEAPAFASGSASHVRITHRNTTEVGEMAAYVQGWEQIYDQLTPGPFVGDFTEVWFDGIQIFREQTTQSLQEHCRPWQGCITVGIPLRMDGRVVYDGWEVDEHTQITIKPGEESLLRTSPALDLIAVALPMDELMEFTRILEGNDAAEALVRAPAALRDPAGSTKLKEFLFSALSSIISAPQLLEHEQLRRAMKHAIYESTVASFGKAAAASQTPRTSSGRRQVVHRAVAYMREHVNEPLSVADLCAELGVSRRTLQYCFEEVLQLNPVGYLRAIRLNGVRRDLLNSDPEKTMIQDVAARWGFWHLSRLATEYRAMFGELPSATLRGAAAPARHLNA